MTDNWGNDPIQSSNSGSSQATTWGSDQLVSGASPKADVNKPADNSLLSQATKPLREIPHDIGAEFSEGSKSVKRGIENLGIGPSGTAKGIGQMALGGLQEAYSPLSGTVKAIVSDPVKAQFPKDSLAGEFAGNLSGDAALMFGPSAVAKSASSIAQMMPKLNSSVKTMMDAGIKLTPGQIFQGIARKVEEAVKSTPVLGSFISHAQMRSVEDFNKAVINKSLSQVGEKLPDKIQAGRKAMAYADNALSQKYDKLLPKLTLKSDPQFSQEVSDIAQNNARRLSDTHQKQWNAALEHIQDHFDPSTGTMDGASFKSVESELSHLARNNFGSPNPTDKEFAKSINDLRASFRDALERSNPKYAKELQNLNSAWATFAKAQGASIRNVKTQGLFSPADLLRDIKSSSSKGMFARGDAQLQPLAEAAMDVLPDDLSFMKREKLGFYERGLWLGLMGAGEEGMLGHLVTPGVVVPAAGATALYTKPGISAVNKAVAGAPRAAAATGQALESPTSRVLSTLGIPPEEANQQ